MVRRMILMRKFAWFSLLIGSLTLPHPPCRADGMFVFKWNKQLDINEPTQKAIILHDQGREDLILQVKYEGPAEEFGWLVPVPTLPEVTKGSMDPFYELSQLTQRQFPANHVEGWSMNSSGGRGDPDDVKVIKIQTVGAYEVAILATGNAAKLTEWLDANGFVFPADKGHVLDAYVAKQFYFVAIKIDPEHSGFSVQKGSPKAGAVKKAIAPSTRKQLANGELHPLIISFASAKCFFPLAISALNGKPSEISLYVLSAAPLMSRTIFDKQFALYSKGRKEWLQHASDRRQDREERLRQLDLGRDERYAQMRSRLAARGALRDDDPADPQPPASRMRKMMDGGRFSVSEPDYEYPGEHALVPGMPAGPKELVACAKALPRLAGKTWWLVKQVEVFAPEEMRDLEFEPAVPLLTGLLDTPDAMAQGFTSLAQFGALAVPAVLEGMKSSEPEKRRFAVSAAGTVKDPRLGPASVILLRDTNDFTRELACDAIGQNWQDEFARPLVERLSDPSVQVRRAAGNVLQQHPTEALLPTYRKLLAEDTVAAEGAVRLVGVENFSRPELLRLLSSTNLAVVSTGFTRLRHQLLTLEETEPLLTNSLPMARLMGLGELSKIGSPPAVDRIVALLRDPDEMVRWRTRGTLRRLTGQKLGPDPAAYEQWWKQNRDVYIPPSPTELRSRNPLSLPPDQ
jgi:HEAT repeat protein